MKTITTIDELIKALDNKSDKYGYLETMKSIKIPIREFEKYYSWKQDSYARNCLVQSDDFELLLICYEKGQETPIHDFNSMQAWIHVIQGKLKEERYRVQKEGDELEQLSSITLGTDDFSFMSELGIHRYKNVYEARSVSLNLYCNKIESWTQYDKNGNSKIVKVNYDSVYV